MKSIIYIYIYIYDIHTKQNICTNARTRTHARTHSQARRPRKQIDWRVTGKLQTRSVWRRLLCKNAQREFRAALRCFKRNFRPALGLTRLCIYLLTSRQRGIREREREGEREGEPRAGSRKKQQICFVPTHVPSGRIHVYTCTLHGVPTHTRTCVIVHTRTLAKARNRKVWLSAPPPRSYFVADWGCWSAILQKEPWGHPSRRFLTRFRSFPTRSYS